MGNYPYDWRTTKKGWPYKSLDDPEYIKDKEDLFSEKYENIEPKYKLRNGWAIFRNNTERENWINGVTPKREYNRRKPQGGRMDLEGNPRGIK